MYEFICKECGQVKQVRRLQEVRTFCSVSCASTYNRRMSSHGDSHVDKSYPWKRAKGNRRWVCRYNPEGCACEDRNCSKCGHNPEVAQARTKAFMEGLK